MNKVSEIIAPIVADYFDMKCKVVVADNCNSSCFQFDICDRSVKGAKCVVFRPKIYYKTLDLIQKSSVGCGIGSSFQTLLGSNTNLE